MKSTRMGRGLLFSAGVLLVSYPAAAYKVLHELNDVTGTVYYDAGGLKGANPCANVLGGDAGPAMLSGLPPGCEWDMTPEKAPFLADLNTNRIVAIDEKFMDTALYGMCGKEVKVFRQDGSEVTIGEGPFILWDRCLACSQSKRIDFSAPRDPHNQRRARTLSIAKGHMAARGSGATNCDMNPTGLKYQIIDNQIWQPATGDDWSPNKKGPVWPFDAQGGPLKNGDKWKSLAGGSGSGSGSGISTGSSGPASGAGVGAGAGAGTGGAPPIPQDKEPTVKPPPTPPPPPPPSPPPAPAPPPPPANKGSADVTTNEALRKPADLGTDASSGDDNSACSPFGAYQCQGNQLQRCIHASPGKSNLAWFTSNNCPTVCKVEGAKVQCN